MYNSNFFGVNFKPAFSGGLLGVLLLILMPASVSAFQVDSLQLSQSLEGLAQSILRFADYDADGDLDLIIAGTNSSSESTTILYKNNGSGSFSEDNSNTITGFNYPGLSWGDIDGDGDLDFVISGNTSSGYQAKIYLNNGSGVFTEAASDPFYDAYWGNMELGDLDNDGDLDVFQTGLQSNGVRVAEIFWNDGKGGFTIDTNNSLTGTGDGETPLADLDNDGDLDILLSGYIDAGGNITQIHLNDGNGNFTLSQSLQGVASNGMDFGDYDNDGDLDLILTGRDYSGGARRAYIYENDGSASFAIDTSNTIAPVSYSNAKWGDYDHDGDLDVILSGFGDGGFRETYIYTNNGTGTMSYTSNGAISGSEEGYVYWADLDGDGFLEVAITGWDGSVRMTKIYQNIRTTSNSLPISPSNLQAAVVGDSVSFSWDASTDADGGPISYAMFFHNGDSSRFLIPAYADTSTGYRTINGLGNVGLNNSHKIAKTNIPYGTFSWGVQAIDGTGKSGGISTSTVNIAPTVPSGLTITRNELEANLSWAQNPTDSVDYYIVYKEDNNSGQIDSLGFSNDTSFTFSGLAYGNTYDFYVATKTTSGFTSDRSDSVEVVVPALTAPTSLAFTRNDLSVDLNWDANIDVSVDYYIIYKEDDNSGQVDSLGSSNTNSFTYPSLNYGNTYNFYVATKTTTGFSSNRSDSVEVSTPALTAPTGLILTQNKLVADLKWEADSVVPVDYYIIYKEENNSGQIDSLGFSNDTTFSFSGLNDGTTYDFYVATKTTSGFTSTRSDSVELTVDFLRYSLVPVEPQGNQAIGSFNSIVTFDFADYNLDGDYDMLAFGYDTVSGYLLRVFDNDGSGNFSNSSFSVSTIDDSDPANLAVKWVDANLDNYPDVFFSGYSTGGRTRIYLNNGDGTFTDSNQQLIDTWSKDAYLWMDFDIDGDDDLLLFGSEVLNSSSQFTLLYLNDGYGNFSVEDSSLFMTDFGGGDLYPALFGPFERYDYDNDRDYDLIAHTSESIFEMHIFENQGGLNFVKDTSTPFGSVTAEAIAIADANNDGYMDIMFTGKDDSEDPITHLYLNNSTGNNYSTGLIKYTGFTFPGVAQSDIKIWDLNNDGANEFILAGDSSDVAITRVYSNLVETTGIFEIGPANIFEENDDELPQVIDAQIQVLDLNNDSDLDIFLIGNDATEFTPKHFYLENTIATDIPSLDNSLVYSPSGSIVNDSLKIGNLPSYSNYSFYLYNTDNSKYYINPKADISSGYRLFPSRSEVEFYQHTGDGTSDIELNHTFKRNYLPGGNYVIGVQGIDDVSGRGSAFKTTNVKLGPMAPRNVVTSVDSANLAVTLTWNQNPGTNTDKYVIYQTVDTLLTASAYDLNTYDYSAITVGETTDTTFIVNSVPANTNLYYYVAAFTNDVTLVPQFSELSDVDSVHIYNPVLDAPTNLIVTRNELQVSLSWDSEKEFSVDYYIIYKEDNNSGQIDSLSFTTDTSFTYSGLEYGNTYDFSVATKTTSGQTSNRSDSVEVVVPVLIAPVGLVVNRNELSVDLEWTANQGVNIDYYIIYKENNNSGQVDSLSFSNDTTFTYTGLNYGNTYHFYVAAKTTAGITSSRSDSVEVIVPALNAPVGLIANRKALEVDLTWNANNEVTVNYYIIYKEDNNSGQIDSLGFSSDTTFNYTGLEYDNVYDFYVATKTTAGVISSRSDSVEIIISELLTQISDPFTGVNLSATAWGDYDNDGDLDVVITGTNGNAADAISELYDNDGSGTFTKNITISNLLIDVYRSGADFGDFDNDGDLDLVIIGYNSSNTTTTTLYENGGNGTFSIVNNTGLETGSWASANWADFDNDGFLDLFLGGLPGSGNRFNIIYKNNGDGTFTNFNAGLLGTAGGDFVTADYDNDGDLDVALVGFSNAGYTQTRFYKNNNGTFTEISAISALMLSSDNTSLHWVDYDNDGDLDLFNIGADNARLLVNDGNGGLTNTGPSFVGVSHGSADWIDFDLDGDMDLIYSGLNNGQKTFMYTNNGDGTFTQLDQSLITGLSSGTSDFIDFDNDGDADILVTGYSGSSFEAILYQNNSITESILNEAPSAPDSLNYSIISNKLTLDWSASTDVEGGPISYNVTMVNTDSTGYLIATESDTTSGFRKVNGLGNTGLRTSLIYEFNAPPNGNYRWKVQAIDASGKVSDFASSGFSVVNTYTGPDEPANISAIVNDFEVTLSWDSTSSVYFESFNVYLESDSISSPSNLLTSTTDTSYTATGLKYDTDYFFYVTHVDEFGDESIPGERQHIKIDGILSLKNDTTFTGVHLGATAWGDYDNDGDYDLVITGIKNGGGSIAELYDNDGTGNFTKNVSVSNTLIEAYRSGAAFGDYDNDGYVDLVIIGYNGSGVGTTTLYHNEGDGSFSIVQNTGFNNGSWASAYWGEFNNDGYLDLFLSGVNPNNSRFNSIYTYNGDGTFTEVTTNLLGSAGGDFVAADYDNDGDTDVALVGYTDASNVQTRFYRNDSGFFNEISAISALMLASDNTSLHFVDFDNDGDLDFFNTGANNARLLINDGAGNYTNSGQSFFGVNYGDADWIDIDLDGDLDLIYAGINNGSKIYFYENDNNGTFTLNTNYPLVDLSYSTVNFVDTDNDGDSELFITGVDASGSSRAILYDNIISATNNAPTKPLNLTTNTQGGYVNLTWDPATDLEGDALSYNVYVYSNSESSLIASSQSDTTTGLLKIPGFGNAGPDTSYTISLASGNYKWGVQAIDGAGKAGLFATSTDSIQTFSPPSNLIGQVNGTSVALNWNASTSAEVQYYKVFQVEGNNTADSIGVTSDTTFTVSGLNRDTNYYFYVMAVNQEGFESIATSVVQSYIDPLLDAISNSLPNNSWFPDQVWGDYDNDGDLDLIVPLYDEILIYDNDGNGGMTQNNQSVLLSNNLNTSTISLIDFDNDGDLDIYSTGEYNSSGFSKLYLNNGTGTYSLSDINIEGVYRGNHDWGDVNNDGFEDLLIIGRKTYSNYIAKLYLNNKKGSFSEDTLNTFEGLDVSDTKIIDYDNDGDLDISISGYTLNNGVVTKLYKNNGSGEFDEISTSIPGGSYGRINWADYDNDGDQDLLLCNSNFLRIYRNDVESGFSNSFSFQLQYCDAKWGDLDNDGDLDFVAVGANFNWPYTTRSYAFINDGTGTFNSLSLGTGNYYSASSPSIHFVDYDNDGDLDVNQMAYFKAFYQNNTDPQGTEPTEPTNVQFTLTSDTLSVTWDSATDPNNSTLTYEVSITHNESNLVTPFHSDTLTGYRKIIRSGNAGLTTQYSITGMLAGSYKVGVQAINVAKQSSPFEFTEQQIGSYILFSDDYLYADKDSLLVFDNTRMSIFTLADDSTSTFGVNSNLSGTLFIDSNNNNIAESEEVLQTGQSYPVSALKTDTLKYTSSIYQLESSPLVFPSIDYIYPSGKVPSIVVPNKNPEIQGIADQGGWYLLSNSMNTTLGTFLENVWTQGAINADTDTGTPNLYTYSQDSSKYVPLTTDLDTTTLAAGTGLLAYLFPDDNYNDSEDPVDGGWPKVLSNYGNPFGASVQIPIRNVDVDGSGSTTSSEGFALIGNPYGFPISVDSLIAELTEVDEYANRYVYEWDPINKRYELKLSGSVAPYTSFFIRSVQSGASGNVDLEYNDFYEEVNPKTVPEIEFDFTLVHEETKKESIWKLKTTEKASSGIDPNDGYYLGSYASSFANLYSLVDDQPLVVNNLPNQAEEIFNIPIYLDATLSGDFQLSWNNDQLPEDWTIELQVVETGELVNIMEVENIDFILQQKVKKQTHQPSDFYTFDLAKSKKSLQPVFILKVNTGNTVNNENDLGIPREVELYQNYPNPFNPSSIIRFGVPEQAQVQLEVFDILGRKVMTLLNGELKQPGRYNINFDGRTLASGMYIYRLVIGDKVLTKKMTLIK